MFIEHVNVTVTDIQRSIDFYRQLFGWRTRWQATTNAGLPAAHVGDDRCYVAMFQTSRSGTAVSDYEAVGFNHFGVVVDSLEAMKQRLAGMGVAHGDEQDYEPGRRVYLTDPDGHEIELVQYAEALV